MSSLNPKALKNTRMGFYNTVAAAQTNIAAKNTNGFFPLVLAAMLFT